MAPEPLPASHPLVREFRRFVTSHLGLHFSAARWPDLWRGLLLACPDLGFADPEACMRSLLAAPLTRQQSDILASHLTIGETYFFREPNGFEVLEQEILPDLLAARRTRHQSLRIWSAGCATGEEPYSIAMLLQHRFPELLAWRLTILGTDINPLFLQKAAAGLYSQWSFRGTPAWVKESCFIPRRNGQFELRPEIRRLVTFAYLNLAQDAFPSVLNNTNAMDIIFCRNVLMYFTPEIAARVVQHLDLALVDGGWLSLSPCDVSHLEPRKFQPSRSAGIVCHQKQTPSLPILSRGEPTRPPSPVSTPKARAPQPSSPPPSVPPSSLVPVAPSPSAPPSSPVPVASPLPTQAAELYAGGHYAQVVELLTRYWREHPKDISALELLARACANQGRLAEALGWCQKGLARDKLHLSLQFLRATILQEQGQTEEAIAALRRVLYLDPHHLLAHFALGNICHQLRRFPEADRHFAEALELLKNRNPEEVIPESDGITAGRLRAIIESTLRSELAA